MQPKIAPAKSVQYGNEVGTNDIDAKIFGEVLDKIKTGRSFPNLEDQYQLAIGNSKERAMLLEGERTRSLGRLAETH
jgi:hypothetical protein